MKTAVFVSFFFLLANLDALEICHIDKLFDEFTMMLHNPTDWLELPAWQNWPRPALPR